MTKANLVRQHHARKLLDECVTWIGTDGQANNGVVTDVTVGIAKVAVGDSIRFVRVGLLRPFWGAWR